MHAISLKAYILIFSYNFTLGFGFPITLIINRKRVCSNISTSFNCTRKTGATFVFVSSCPAAGNRG